MFSRTQRCIIPAFILLILVFTGCSPAAETIEPVPATTYEIPVSIVYPEAPVALGIVSGLPGMIRLIGYSGSDFVTGTVEVSNRDWIPETEKSGGRVNLMQNARIMLSDSQYLTNLWKLRVSDNVPFQLEIRNVQAEGHWNFSGLPITDLYAELGTAKNAFTFDQPNPTVMQKCEFQCGTGDVVVEGILNAACRNMVIEAGKGSLNLRFGGKELLQDLKVTIYASVGTTSIAVFPDIPARITVTGRGHVIQGDGLIKLDGEGSGSIYETASYRGTQSKTVEISISGGSSIIYLNASP
ncbi:MAG: hypothetical protein WC369_09165 [Dehalococcoidales bacterium]|jgi:hypothetical protein